ncbi:hypothetical protein [Aquamicrobium sp. LC103]|uniref:hypothetical protein n=1 Tax=Aquamicrobium sp. LC103 TaxID=1120658 RepID=UPI00063EBAEF|nr:hypothetical protein [Aquamicrobium sp. LC103]
MKVVIEFYRVRREDNARALIGRSRREVANPDDAVEIAASLATSLEMPQKPDAIAVMDLSGTVLRWVSLTNSNETLSNRFEVDCSGDRIGISKGP